MFNWYRHVEFFWSKTYRLLWSHYFFSYENGLFFICCKGCEVIPTPRMTKITNIRFKMGPHKTVNTFGDKFPTKRAEVIRKWVFGYRWWLREGFPFWIYHIKTSINLSLKIISWLRFNSFLLIGVNIDFLTFLKGIHIPILEEAVTFCGVQETISNAQDWTFRL